MTISMLAISSGGRFGGGVEVDPDTLITAAGGNYVEPEADELLAGVVAGAGAYEVKGLYVPIADSDTVDGGVEFGVGEEGTGVNATSILTALGLATGNLDTQLTAIKAETAEIVEDTNELQTNQGNWLTADISDLPTNSELATALEGVTIDTTDLAKEATVDAVQADMTKVKAAVYDSAPMGNDGYIVLSNGTRVLVSAAGRAITE